MCGLGVVLLHCACHAVLVRHALLGMLPSCAGAVEARTGAVKAHMPLRCRHARYVAATPTFPVHRLSAQKPQGVLRGRWRQRPVCAVAHGAASGAGRDQLWRGASGGWHGWGLGWARVGQAKLFAAHVLQCSFQLLLYPPPLGIAAASHLLYLRQALFTPGLLPRCRAASR